ncbi:hypothetical protein HA402_009975 [Bradysia odoriphaga]|nr:hypothetical protein HA402_009975 [Bradysia odoriphaga]
MRRVSSQNFDQIVIQAAGEDLRCVFLWGQDCYNCNVFKQTALLHQEALSDLGLSWFEADVYADEPLGRRFSLHGVPTFVLFRAGKRLGRITGWPGLPQFTAAQTEVNLPYITADASGPKHLNLKITRAKLESLVEELINRTIEPCRVAIKDAGVKDAEANAEEDHRIAELALTRNQADGLIHSTRKSLAEHGDKLDAADKESIESAIKDVEAVLQDGDKAAIDAKVEALNAAAQKLGEKMYADMQAQQAAQSPQAGEEAKPADDNVVDAEFKEVKRDQ